MTSKSITQRWLFKNLGVIVIALVLIEISLIFAIRSYYYSSAEQYLNSQISMVSNVLLKYSQDGTTNLNTDVRNIVETYEDKERVELMAIDTRGRVSITSSGFSPPVDMDISDYFDARVVPSGFASSISKLTSGEKYMAITVILPSTNSEFEAIRMMTSLDEIDNQIIVIVAIISFVLISILFLTAFSGIYFIKSIVIPVQQISLTARQFATGDFTDRIKKRNDDELGELCDSLNYMADELSNTETLKNEFISSVSHELRTPLTAIKGWAETLYDMDDLQTVKKGMTVIVGESERLSQMVEELLDFSKIQNGRFSLQKSMMDILAELGDAVLIYQEKANRDNLKIVYYEPDMLPIFYGDKNRIRQVFINIIDNAIKYSNSGGTISIEAYEEDGTIIVLISDTGVGINASDLPKIKSKFYKANSTRRGSGIGLAVADEIISMHGGTLTINSEVNVGTTVMIALPVATKKSEQIEQNKTLNKEERSKPNDEY